MENYENLTKAELIQMLQTKSSNQGRKGQVLEAIKNGYDSIEGIASHLGITTKNVSSQLTYLRKDGYKILSVSAGGDSVLVLLSDEDYAKLIEKK